MDEVGRGTTVDDGLAIAFASVHHLATVNGCRAMFATHFHELADMLGYDSVIHRGQGLFSQIAFFCTDVNETKVCLTLSPLCDGLLTVLWTYRISTTLTRTD